MCDSSPIEICRKPNLSKCQRQWSEDWWLSHHLLPQRPALLWWHRLEKNKLLDANLTKYYWSENTIPPSKEWKREFLPHLPKANVQSQVCKGHFMCRAAILLLTALVINSELHNEEIKVLIICTKFLWYFSSLSYHWELFPENCLVKIVVLSSLECYLQAMLIWLNNFCGDRTCSSPQPSALALSCLRPLHCHVKLFSSRSCPFYLVTSSPQVTSPLSLEAPTVTITSFSTHRVEGIHKKLWLQDMSPSLCSPWRGFGHLVKVIHFPGPLNLSTKCWCNCLSALPHSSPCRDLSPRKYIGLWGKGFSSCLRRQM